MKPPNRHERRKRTAKQRRIGRTSESLPPEIGRPAYVEHPFSHVPREALLAALVEAAKQANVELPRLRQELIAAARQCSPEYFLTSMVHAALLVGMRDDGSIVNSETGHWEKKLQQYHVELAQAVYLTIPAEELSLDPCGPQIIQSISDKLFDICEAFQQARFVAIESAATRDQQQLLRLQEHIRMHTFGIRNWGYYSQCVAILHELFGPLNAACERLVGLRATDFVRIFDAILRSIERGAKAHREKLRAAFSKETKREIVNEYGRQFDISPADVAALVETMRIQRWGHKGLKFFLLGHSWLHATDIYFFETSKLAELSGLTTAGIETGLATVSMTFGALHDFNFEHLFLGNPVWEKPVIKVADGEYFCFLPQLFFAFSFSIFGAIFDQDPKVQQLHSVRRSEFLEHAIERIFDDAFGKQVVRSNARWIYDDISYETDLLIQIDSQLFIIEAKSHRISWPALRGAPDRLKRHIQEVLVNPAIQSKRLENAIREWQSGDQSRLKLVSEVNLADVKDVVRLSITLEDFATIQSNLSELNDTGLVDANFPMALTLSLADLQSVFAILDNPVERIFYLKRRSELQEKVKYIADELDLLGLYLATGFELGELEAGANRLAATGMSASVDEYFQALDQQIARPKPRRRMTSWFKDMAVRLTEAKPGRWTEAAVALLSVDYESQQEIEKHFTQLRREAFQFNSAPERENQHNVGVAPKMAHGRSCLCSL